MFTTSQRNNCLFVLLSFFYFSTVVSAGLQDGQLDIYWIDVEGGAATLIVTPAGESVLIDTGNPGTRDPDRIVRVLSRKAGLTRIDHLIVTHYHLDHYGGAATLSKMLPIGTLYDNGLTGDMPEPNPEQSYLDLTSERRQVINPGDRIPLKQSGRELAPEISLRCLGTRYNFIDAPENTGANSTCSQHRPKDRDGSDNARSVVVLLKCGAFDFFDGGDLTWNQEQRLVCPQNLVGSVDVYQVTHHGLDSSNNPVILQSLQPAVAVMNNGATKGCMPEVFANLTETKSLQAIYQVHKNLRPDGAVNNAPEEFIANHEDATQCQGNYIHLSVDPAGNAYTVEIPATGHRKTFHCK